MKKPKVTFKALAADERFLTLSENNLKLVPNKDTKFLIWNLPSKITCPFATDMCKNFCYAVKAEKNYPDVLPSRLKHLAESKEADFAERMIYTIEAHLTRPSYKNAKKIIVRIHESGDFYNQHYADKWVKIADHFKHNKKVVFMAYTKSIVYFGSREHIPNNMVIRFSVWDDTPQYLLNLATEFNYLTYSAVKKFTKDIKSQNRCLCRDCAKCGKCWSNTKRIICEIH